MAARKQAATARAEAPVDKVTVTLAHPISRAVDKQYLGLPQDDDYPVGTVVTVNRNAATSLINNGLAAGVDPQDPDAVREFLAGGGDGVKADVTAEQPPE